MQEKTTKYQLRRMVLVNVGTNMHVPSGRITAIDPRGGAAVLGDNGVGKTTTLRILPLFFGHLPSQIVAAGKGQEAMVRFVLPTDASAIAFEYQRGSDHEDDLRLAVIRRRGDDPDVPFYRLYRGGFRKELFVDEGRFLADDETQLKATELQIATTSKLTTSEYRSVILRTHATSKERDRLRRYSVDWSFGPKQLDNLDRIVAAMVKKHISFTDIVQVAVGLAQHDLGQGAERAKLTFKQGRAPIERWLRNRDACADAFKHAPSITELEDDLKEHRAAEASYRARRADVAALKAARAAERAALKKTLESLQTARYEALEAEGIRRTELSRATELASRQATTAAQEYNTAQLEAQTLETEKAAHWERLLQDLPGLKASLQAHSDQIAVAESAQAEAVARYGRMEQEAHTNTADLKFKLEQEKEPHRVRLAEATTRIAAAEATAYKSADDEAEGRRKELDEAKEPLLEQKGVWEGRKNSPSASDEALGAADEAGRQLQRHTEDLGQVQQVAAKAEAAKREATLAFEAQETSVRKAKVALEAWQSALAEAQARLTPAEGTFLAALRTNADESWKRTLAKVVNPSLLERDDLDPVAVEEAAHTLYGWRLNTGVIASPDWADDAQARLAVDSAQERRTAAKANLEREQSLLSSRSRQVQDADISVQTSQARLTVLKSQTEERKTQLETARLRVSAEKRNATDRAITELTKIQRALDDLKRQRQTLETDQRAARQAVKNTHDAQRAAATRLHDEALSAINANVAQLQAELVEQLKRIAAQLNEHLSSAGVDINRLNALRAEVTRLREEVQSREDRMPLVDRWRKWLAAGGATRVETLRAEARRATEGAQTAAGQLAQFEQSAVASQKAYGVGISTHTNRLSAVEDDIEVLDALDASFGDYLALGNSAIDFDTPAKELRSKARAVHNELERLEREIGTRTTNLRQSLTAKNNAVRELVEASLEPVAAGSVISRGAALCTCYKLIGPQVANDVNITLKTLLANIGAFHKAIQSFEKEVSAFNRRLQEGLNEVKCFERVKDLRLDIVTNFEGLGFYKKLSRMEEVVRQHASEFGKDYTRDLPSDETARALGDFMSVLSADGNVEVNLSSHITLRGSVSDNGNRKEFKRSDELENISSEGLTSLVLITLLTALLNTIRGAEPVHVPWVTDEVGKFDPKNFRALMQRLRDNRIDVVTASPELGTAQQAMFAQRYLFEDKGRIREYRPLDALVASTEPAPQVEALQ